MPNAIRCHILHPVCFLSQAGEADYLHLCSLPSSPACFLLGVKHLLLCTAVPILRARSLHSCFQGREGREVPAPAGCHPAEPPASRHSEKRCHRSQRVKSFQESVIASNEHKCKLEERFVAGDSRARRPCVLSGSPQYGRERGSWQLPPILLLAWSCSMPGEERGASSANTAKPGCSKICCPSTFPILSR